jgi:hypothetical protein
MKEDYIETLHQQDTNLRDAIRLEEEALPPMPADLNARLMQRVEEESAKEVTKRRRVRVLWPVVAAACVAALIAVFLTPPKGTPEDGMSAGKPVAVKVDKPKKEKEAPQKTAPTEAPQEEVAEQPKVTRPAATTSQPLLAQKPEKAATSEEVVAAVASSTEQSIPETPRGETTTVMLTERDIPITRPENYQYTPEEIALMKKQANEAYLKWVELELEISKYTLEKMAQK